MDWYNDGSEFYDEPSEFDQQINEFKSSLLKAVKEEYISEMERLKKENEELQDVKKNFEQIKRDYNNEKRKLHIEYDHLKANVRRERLGQLMKDLEVELYTVASKSKYQPKCEKCDEKRRIYYTTPSGKETYETCECDKRISVYEPIPTLMSSFSIRDGKGFAWYRVVDGDKYDGYLSYYEDSISGQELVTSEDQFEEIGYAYKTLFQDKEIAQKFCDFKNNKSK
jgi:hypothetical protein